MPSHSIAQFSSIEMGVCKETEGGEQCVLVPIDNSVRENLVSMLNATYDQLEGEREEYELTQKYATKEKLVIQASNPLGSKAQELYRARNMPTDARALDEPEDVTYYFATFRRLSNRKILAVRRAAQFKGMLSARNRLVKIIDETLRVVNDPVFRLDVDFDYLVEPDQILILRPSGFEYTASVDGYAEEAVTSNIEDLGTTLDFVDFAPLTSFVQSHKRAARTVAALRSRVDLGRISKSKLRKLCRETGVRLVQREGKLSPAEGHEDSFLMVLDRRRYAVSLIENEDERYEARNRRAV